MTSTSKLKPFFEARSSSRRSLSANETVFAENASAESVFFVEKGCVRLVVFPQDSKQMVLYRAQAGETFGEEHLLLNRYCCRAIADEASVIRSVCKDVLLDAIEADSETAIRFIGSMSQRYSRLKINYERLGIQSAKARVLHLLCTLCDTAGKSIDLSGKIKSLSSDLNLSHEATYRALKELESEGAISRNRGSVTICQVPLGL